MTVVPLVPFAGSPVEPALASPPHNLDAEQALLGALLFDNAAYERLGDNLQGRHFFEPFHGRLYGALEEFIRRGQLAEPIVMAERFKTDVAFNELGGIRYLADLVDRAPPAAHAPDFGRLVYELALRRDLIRLGGEISADAAAAEDPEIGARDMISIAETKLYNLAETGGPSTGFVAFGEALRARSRWRPRRSAATAASRACPPA
jgi:replicative DNA helicase